MGGTAFSFQNELSQETAKAIKENAFALTQSNN